VQNSAAFKDADVGGGIYISLSAAAERGLPKEQLHYGSESFLSFLECLVNARLDAHCKASFSNPIKIKEGKMKNLLLVVSLVLLLCFAFGCQNKAEKADLEKFRAQAKLEEQNKAIAAREWEAWSKGDFEAFKEVVAPGYAWYEPSGSTKPRSLEEAIETGRMVHRNLPDVTFSIEEMFAAGNRVIVRYIMRGTQPVELQALPATGKKIEVSGIMIHRIENGRVVEDREEFDMFGLNRQLGMELKPKEVKK